ncbi:helix-turn-helix domain-containing protein [Microbacterium sp. W1N]|uniref:helix-turn-helix domain-containing protein n=1 Tax=Microbacterium festucae TaxID=2977531 RepID=UPI0021C0594C|nr:helix-turn-helix domain-containing protein [Microbacterium festucae]MCT9819010.1 helix-turn-helix domain-containing protein [Microbacterium festucae]
MSGAGSGSSVGQALAVLEEVARSGPTLSANGIARALGLPRASAYRLINSLVSEEYLLRHPTLDGFSLGVRVVELAHLVAPTRPLSTAEVVAGVRAETGVAVHLARYQRGRVVIVDEDPGRPLRSLDRTRQQLASTAIGRVLLAAYAPPLAAYPDQDAVATVVQTARASGITPQEHREIAAEVFALGYALAVDPSEEQRACVAVPLRTAEGRIVGALAAAAAGPSEAAAQVGALTGAARRLADALSIPAAADDRAGASAT